MRTRTTPRFDRAFATALPAVQQAMRKQARRLLEDFRHPSLQTHPVPGRPQYFQGRVTFHWRFYYYLDGHTYVLTDLFKHKD
jgi:hypothetical protein